MRQIIRLAALISILPMAFLIYACSADRGNWQTITDASPLSNHTRSFYIERFGEPLLDEKTTINRGTDDNGTVVAAQKVFWLIRSDGGGPSDRPDEGWEFTLFFDSNGQLLETRVGTYRTPLTVADVMTAARKVGYSDE